MIVIKNLKNLVTIFPVVAFPLLGLVIFGLVVWYIYGRTNTPPPPEWAIFRDPEIPIEVRIDDLLSYMTLEEKIGQMALVEKDSIKNIEDISVFGLGGLLSGAGAKPYPNTKESWSAMVESYTDTARNSRLSIPILFGVDAIHGHGNVPGATIFPHPIGLGATGDEELVKRIAAATAEELLATGIRWNYAPTLDLPRDIRWGRTYEAFSDDPVLVQKFAVAYLQGLQGTDKNMKVLATPKHFIGVGAMIWNSSKNKDFFIDQGVTEPDEQAFRSEYLLPFKSAVDNGAQSIMAGLNSWGDTELAAEGYLINDVLKGELGFTGFVVSDWYGVYEIPGGNYSAAVTAINAGVDMVMLPFEYKEFIGNVAQAVHAGDIREERIDDAVRRIFRAKFALGLFDSPQSNGHDNNFGSQEHRLLAREAVAKSLVLLKNENQALPINEDIDLIRVAGSAADNTGRQAGAWTIEWQGVDGNVIPGATSILAGIREVADQKTRIEYNQEGSFPATERADVGIAVVGESPYAEGWGDKALPALNPEDLEVIRRLGEVSEKVVVVLVTGRPLILPTEFEDWDALVVAWLPGSEGAGVADVLFGDVAVSGKLPLPWPKTIEQLPISASGITADNTKVLFPRYFGLRY